MCSNSGEDPQRREMDPSRVFSDRPTMSHGNLLSLGNFDMILRGTKPAIDMDETSRRRYFSNLSGYLSDHEYQDDQLPGKKRRLTNEQVNLLEESFEEENKLEPQRKNQLAKRLGLPPRQVAVWFQNRRARWKAKQIERDYDFLKSSYDSLLERHELILKENEKLKSEVFNLTERLLGNGINQEPATNRQPGICPGTARLNAKVYDNWSSCTVLSPSTDEDYFSDAFRAADRQNRQPNEEPFSWWVWPETSRPLW